MTQQEHEPRGETAEAERLAGLGRVAGELMHDLANLVAVLDGRLRLALGDARAGRMPVGELERAVEGSADLGAMLRDVLEVLREEAVSPEVVADPQAVAERAIRRLLEGSRPLEVRLLSSLPGGVGVRGRASFLHRALANLLANASRHARREVRVVLAPGERAGTVLLAVEDDGPGVPPEQRDEVFRPLVRGRGGGTGLGLSSVAWTVRQLGGEVRCTGSEELGGARIEVTLPVAAPLAASASPARRFAGKRLLVVDDNPDVRRALGRFLRRLGAEVVEMGGAETGEQLLHHAIRAIPDAVLLDLHLGLRTGVEVWHLLDEQLPHLAQRVVFLTGFGPGDALHDAASATGQPVLGKPFDFEELAAALEAAMRRR